jgi:Protein of unknown function (DUF2442)
LIDNGRKGVVDLENFLFDQNSGVFARLQDKEQFKNFAINFHTLVWGDDLDLAPEFLHNLLLKNNAS